MASRASLGCPLPLLMGTRARHPAPAKLRCRSWAGGVPEASLWVVTTSLQLLGLGKRAGNLGAEVELAPVALPPWPLQGPSWYVAKPIPGARAAATVAARPWGGVGCWAALEAMPGSGPEAHVVA